MGLDKIANKTTESQADFKLVASGCMDLPLYFQTPVIT
ncbi:hypothetical protein ECDEC13D_0211 [Escherichia coli DEC13D]|nr:hypothetical protein ECDEC13D_0211 [Escherichia coli DEC13D]